MKSELEVYLELLAWSSCPWSFRVTNVTPLMAYKHQLSKRMIRERGEGEKSRPGFLQYQGCRFS